MSANTPILQLILEKLTSLDTKVDVLTSRVDVLTSRVDVLTQRVDTLQETVTQIQKHIKTESDIQEYKYTNQLKTYLFDNSHGKQISIILFGNFYVPNTNNPLTDIDGCVLETDMITNERSQGHVYFIEAKHAITKPILTKKLEQFITILHTIQDIQKGKDFSKAKEKFKTMVVVNNMKQFPKHISFLLSSEQMSPDVIKLITAITRGELTEKVYNDLLFDYIYNHTLLRDIIQNDKIPQRVKIQIQDMKSMHDFYIVKDLRELIPYKISLESLNIPYTTYIPFMKLKNRLGFINSFEIQLPNDIVNHGFYSVNELVTASQNRFIMSAGFRRLP